MPSTGLTALAALGHTAGSPPPASGTLQRSRLVQVVGACIAGAVQHSRLYPIICSSGFWYTFGCSAR